MNESSHSRASAATPERIAGSVAAPAADHVAHDVADRRRRNTRRWLIAGGALGAVVIGFFAVCLTLQLVVPLIGIVVTALLYGAMIWVALGGAAERRRLRLLMTLMIAIGVTLAVCGELVFLIEAGAFGFGDSAR